MTPAFSSFSLVLFALLLTSCAANACDRLEPYTDESRDGDVYVVDDEDAPGVWEVGGCLWAGFVFGCPLRGSVVLELQAGAAALTAHAGHDSSCLTLGCQTQ